MKKLMTAAALLMLAGALPAAEQPEGDVYGNEHFRVFEVLPDDQGVLARRCTKMTQSKLCVGLPVLLPVGLIPNPEADKVVRIKDAQEDGYHTLQHDNGQKKTVLKMKGTFAAE